MIHEKFNNQRIQTACSLIVEFFVDHVKSLGGTRRRTTCYGWVVRSSHRGSIVGTGGAKTRYAQNAGGGTQQNISYSIALKQKNSAQNWNETPTTSSRSRRTSDGKQPCDTEGPHPKHGNGGGCGNAWWGCTRKASYDS